MSLRARPMLQTAILTMLAGTTLTGCSDRALQSAEKAADRQAAQNRELVRLNREVAAGTSRLVTEDAQSRRQALVVHQQLQEERAGLAAGWSDLEAERKRIAQSRLADSTLSALVQAGGATLAALLALAVAWLTISRQRPHDALSEGTVELLLDRIVSSGNRPAGSGGDDRPQLPAPASLGLDASPRRDR